MRIAARTSWLLVILAGCGPDLILYPSCDPRLLDPGEVRIRRVPCADELIAEGDGRRSDWLLENAVARFVIREVPSALTRHDLAGGGLVDAVAVADQEQGQDLLVEAVPLLGGEWLTPTSAIASPAAEDGAVTLEITGLLPSGLAGSVRYRLEADSSTLTVEGVDALSVVPEPGIDLVGPQVLDDGGDLLGLHGASISEDLGGWLTFADVSAVTVGEREVVHAALWPDGPEVSGESEGAWVEARSPGGDVLARLPISGGRYQGRIPPDATDLRAVQAGHLPGEVRPVADDIVPPVGAYGAVSLEVLDAESEAPIPARLHWRGEDYPYIPPSEDEEEAALLLTGPGEGTAWIEAGPMYEAVEVALTVGDDEEVPLAVSLERAVTPAVLADLGLVASPDRRTRRSMSGLLGEAAGSGVRFALLVAEDEVVPEQGERGEPWIRTEPASQASAAGQPVAWPWSADARKPAHGATDPDDLSAEDLLAAMSYRGNRFTIVTPEWMAQAGPPIDWLPYPDLLRIDTLDLSTLVEVYDAWMPLPLTGPLTWVDGIDPTAEGFAEVDVEAMLLEGRTTAGNGPRPLLRIDGEAPLTVEVAVEAPSWMPLSEAVLIGPGGTVYGRWRLDEEGSPFAAEVVLEVAPSWLILACWGEEVPGVPWMAEPGWAVTSPVWLSAP